MSYAELDARTDGLAAAFRTLGGGGPGCVAFLGENGAVPHEVMIAAAKAGLTYVPIDYRLAALEIRSIFERSRPGLVVGGRDHLMLLEGIRPDAGHVRSWIAAGAAGRDGWVAYEGLVEGPGEGPFDPVPDDGIFCVIFTSGTTGRAKGVTLTHANTVHNGMAMLTAYGIDSHTRFLMSLPYSATGVVNHSSGPTVMAGGAVVYDEARGFDATRFFTAVQRDRVTHCQLVPTMMYRMLDAADRDAFDLSSLQVVGYGSAAIPPGRVTRLIDAFGPVFLQAYGMTECCSVATVLTREDHAAAGTAREGILASCGRAVPGAEIRIVGEAGQALPPGEVGEVLIRTPWSTPGYLGDPEQTAALIRDGWLHTGDMGRLDAEEYLYIVDRMKDVVNTGGSKVYSSEVEAAIASHPDVAEVAVIAVPDPEWGERVHAVVVPRAGACPTLASVKEHAALSLSRYKLPKSMELVADIPKTSTGKYSKTLLRNRPDRF